MNIPVLRPSIFDSLDWLLCGTTLRGEWREGEGRGEMARRVGESLGLGNAAVVTAHQVHGSRVVTVMPGGRHLAGEDAHDRLAMPRPGAHCEVSRADGLVAAAPGVLVGVFTADCVPLVMADPVRRTVAVVHAGRESTRREIARRTVMRLASQGVHPADLWVWIGPSICVAHYEVDASLAAPFHRAFGRRLGGAQGRRLDLAKINRMQLVECGVRGDRIAEAGRCTFEDAALCSYRRDGESAGRMFTFAAIVS